MEGHVMKRMPKVNPRRPHRDGSGDMEGDNDWIANNGNAIMWFLENHKEIRQALIDNQTYRDEAGL
jgi:hypothetical protein